MTYGEAHRDRLHMYVFIYVYMYVCLYAGDQEVDLRQGENGIVDTGGWRHKEMGSRALRTVRHGEQVPGL